MQFNLEIGFIIIDTYFVTIRMNPFNYIKLRSFKFKFLNIKTIRMNLFNYIKIWPFKSKFLNIKIFLEIKYILCYYCHIIYILFNPYIGI